MVFTLYRHMDLLKEHGHFGSYSTLHVFTAHVKILSLFPHHASFQQLV